MSRHRRWDPEEDSALADEIVRAQPDEELADRVAAVAFLRDHGSDIARVVLAGYELERCVGRGGFGRVFLATQPGLGRRVALKLLHRHRAVPGTEWLRREANALAQLSHPNVVQIYQVGESPAGTYIAMEYVEGQSLREWQAGRQWHEVLSAYRQAALGLTAAHARGILHLDFKPTNALVGNDGRVRVADFGLAGGPGLGASSDDRPLTAARDAESSALQTRPGGGTGGYASPEQSVGARVDARSDQFSFCAALYEALHSVLPYAPDEIAAMASSPDSARTPSRGERRAPAWIDRVLRRGLSPLARDRWPSMPALLDALAPKPWHQRVRGLALLGAVIAGLPTSFATFRDDADAVCHEEAAELNPTWDARRRESVEAAMSLNSRPEHDEFRHSVTRRLDRHAEAAIENTRALCSARGAADVSAEQHIDRRRCLRRHRDRFERVVHLLVDGGAQTSVHADALVDEIGDPNDCETPVSLASLPEDVDGPRAAEVVAETDLVRLDVVGGRLEDAEDRAQRAVALAEQIGAATGKAEARLARGIVLEARGRDREALLDLDESGLLAMSIGRDDLAAESWRRASWIAGNDLGDLARAERWARLAGAALQRLGAPPRASAEQLDVEGLLLRLRNDAVGAEAKHRAALLQLELAVDPDDPRWITTWLLLAHALAERGDNGGAAQLYGRALALANARLGAAHPQIAAILLSRALVARELADRTADETGHRAATEDLQRAGAIMTEGQGHNPLLLAAIRTLHAETVLVLGDVDAAEALAREAWSLQQEYLPVGHDERGSALAVLARIELARGDWDVALATHQLYASERAGVDDDDALATVENNIGWLLCRLHRFADARRHHERALERGGALQHAYARAGLGHVALALGATPDAVDHLEAALAMTRSLDGEPPADLVAEAEWHLAEARLAMGEPATRVHPLVESAVSFYRASGSDALALTELERIALELQRSFPVPRSSARAQ